MDKLELILHDTHEVLTRLNDMEDAKSLRELIHNQRTIVEIIGDLHKHIVTIAEELKSS